VCARGDAWLVVYVEGIVLVGGGGVVFLRGLFVGLSPSRGSRCGCWLVDEFFIRGSDLRSECVFCELGIFSQVCVDIVCAASMNLQWVHLFVDDVDDESRVRP
jgi:hypothetical protein